METFSQSFGETLWWNFMKLHHEISHEILNYEISYLYKSRKFVIRLRRLHFQNYKLQREVLKLTFSHTLHYHLTTIFQNRILTWWLCEHTEHYKLLRFTQLYKGSFKVWQLFFWICILFETLWNFAKLCEKLKFQLNFENLKFQVLSGDSSVTTIHLFDPNS